MSDTERSGAETPAAATTNTPSAPANPSPNPTSTFGNNRGSGLARGKRPNSPSAQAAPAASAADYKPTAVSIVTAPTEYKNPFAPPAPAEVPAPEAKPLDPAPAPAVPEVAASAAPAEVAEVEPVAASPSAPAVTSDPAPDSSETEARAELKILPPETPKRVEHSWESRSFRNVAGAAGGEPVRHTDRETPGSRPPRRDDRPVFRPERERRPDRRGEFRPNGGAETPRPEPPAPPPESVEKKSGGLFGWVRKIFGGEPAETPAPAAEPRSNGGFDRPGGHRRRRHRGGRGRRFHDGQPGPREGQSGSRDGQPGGQFPGEPRGQGGDHQPYGRRRRRRHHGGGGGGGYRGNGRPEGGPPAGS